MTLGAKWVPESPKWLVHQVCAVDYALIDKYEFNMTVIKTSTYLLYIVISFHSLMTATAPTTATYIARVVEKMLTLSCSPSEMPAQTLSQS